MSEYFPEPIPSGGRVKVALDLFSQWRNWGKIWAGVFPRFLGT